MLVRSFVVGGLQTCLRDGSNATPLQLRELSATFDASWAPYCQTQLTVVAPRVEFRSGIDPRKGLRTRWSITQDSLDGNPVVKQFDLTFRSRIINEAAGTASISATSDEAVLMDWAQGGYGTGGYPDNSGGINDAMTRTGYVSNNYKNVTQDADLVKLNEHSVPTYQDQDDMWAPGVTAWDYSSQLAQLSNAYLFCDELGTFYLAPRGYGTDSTQQAFGAGNIIDVADAVSRDDPAWANYAVVTFQPPQGSSSTTLAYVSSDSGAAVRKSINVQQNRRKPNSGNAATGVRTSAQKRGRTLTVDAVADIRVRPNQPGVVSYSGGTFQGIIRAVTFVLPAGTMQVTFDVTE